MFPEQRQKRVKYSAALRIHKYLAQVQPPFLFDQYEKERGTSSSAEDIQFFTMKSEKIVS